MRRIERSRARQLAIVTAAVFCSAIVATATQARPDVEQLRECRLESTRGSGSVAALCGRYETRENRDDPKSRVVRLHVAKIPALRLEPAGDYVLSICTNVSCALLGAKALLHQAEEALGPGAHARTADGTMTLHEEECLGACDAAPVVQVNFINYDKVSPERLDEIVAGCRAGQPPQPARGAVPGTLKDISRVLAGLGAPSKEPADA